MHFLLVCLLYFFFSSITFLSLRNKPKGSVLYVCFKISLKVEVLICKKWVHKSSKGLNIVVKS